MALTKKQKAIVSRWTKALRSGKFKQGKRLLRSTDGKEDRYCCLGVLCELAVRARVIQKPYLIDGEFWYDSNAKTLPSKVQEWAGLRSYNGNYGDGDDSLIRHNDGVDGAPANKFTTIAKIIDSKPAGLFV